MSRKEITDKLTRIATDYLTDKLYSVHIEIGTCRRGRRRADLLAMNTKNDLIIVEIKSGAADFRSDKKWRTYLSSCNRMYFCIDKEFYESPVGAELVAEAKSEGVGVMVCNTKTLLLHRGRAGGYLTCKHPARKREVDSSQLHYLLTKMAWRGGHHRGSKEPLDLCEFDASDIPMTVRAVKKLPPIN